MYSSMQHTADLEAFPSSCPFMNRSEYKKAERHLCRPSKHTLKPKEPQPLSVSALLSCHSLFSGQLSLI